MDIRSMADQMDKLDATNQSSVAAIADFIIAGLRSMNKPNQKAFMVTAIQAYALLLQESEIEIVA